MEVVDNFLPQDEFDIIKNQIVFNRKFPFYLCSDVVSGTKQYNLTDNYWNWYGIHLLYNEKPVSEYYKMIDEILIPKFQKIIQYDRLMRVKANFYGATGEVKEHLTHIDCPFPHIGAIFSLNTCDGFTKLHDGTKIDSVANRMLFFDPSLIHNSSTTTTDKGRFNINFNFYTNYANIPC